MTHRCPLCRSTTAADPDSGSEVCPCLDEAKRRCLVCDEPTHPSQLSGGECLLCADLPCCDGTGWVRVVGSDGEGEWDVCECRQGAVRAADKVIGPGAAC